MTHQAPPTQARRAPKSPKPRRRLLLGALGLGLLLTGSPKPASAGLPAAQLKQHQIHTAYQTLGAAPGRSAPRVPVLVKHTERWPNADGVVNILPGYSTAWLTESALEALGEQHPGWHFDWAPARRPLLDRAAHLTGAFAYTEESGRQGQGVVVGILDTGIDPAHPDFRHLDGSTRIAWALDFSKAPTGKHPQLESRYGCAQETPCAIYSAEEINQALSEGTRITQDVYGHGTHVASLAAGNGYAHEPRRYIGVAPEANLIIVRADRNNTGAFYDADIATGTAFIFERAEALGQPAVVNLSLGSDFGAHDGSSDIEQLLSHFVGDDKPGRAIVVAAGNSGSLYASMSPSYDGPWGIHTSVQVAPSSTSRIPILTPAEQGRDLESKVYIWLTFRPEDDIRVGLDDPEGTFIEPLERGSSRSYQKNGLKVSIFNGSTDTGPASRPSSAVVILEGRWNVNRTYALRLEGQGSAAAWVHTEGELSPQAGRLGALFPRAIKQGTISIPGSHPELISVGASLNRLSWPTRRGPEWVLERFGGNPNPTLDSGVYFSGAGPNQNGVLKPDLTAPGALLVGALSPHADPAFPGRLSQMFSGVGTCGNKDPECVIISDFYAVTSGTSMAAPQVSGAVALLFEQDPSLTQAQARRLLQAGARRLSGGAAQEQQLGVGALNIPGSVEAQLIELGRGEARAEPAASQSWLRLANDFVYPDPSWPIEIYAELRAEDGALADGFASGAIELRLENGALKEPFQRIAPGLWRGSFAGHADAGGQELKASLLFNGKTLLERRAPIAVDPHLARSAPRALGGCSFVPSNQTRGLKPLPGQAPPRASSGFEGHGLIAWLFGLAALRLGRRRNPKN